METHEPHVKKGSLVVRALSGVPCQLKKIRQVSGRSLRTELTSGGAGRGVSEQVLCTCRSLVATSFGYLSRFGN